MRVRSARTAVVLEAVDACEGDLRSSAGLVGAAPDFEMSFGKHHRVFGTAAKVCMQGARCERSQHDIQNTGEMSWRCSRGRLCRMGRGGRYWHPW